jgi:hypothetical protein
VPMSCRGIEPNSQSNINFGMRMTERNNFLFFLCAAGSRALALGITTYLHRRTRGGVSPANNVKNTRKKLLYIISY